MGCMLVRDVMVTEVVTLRPEVSVAEAAKCLIEKNVGGVPVVDEEGHLVGLLSDADLLVRQSRLHVPSLFTLFFERGASFPPPTPSEFLLELQKALASTVSELMDPAPEVCSEEDEVTEIATRMWERGISRLPVVRDGRLVGIVARGDLVRLVAEEPTQR